MFKTFQYWTEKSPQIGLRAYVMKLSKFENLLYTRAIPSSYPVLVFLESPQYCTLTSTIFKITPQ